MRRLGWVSFFVLSLSVLLVAPPAEASRAKVGSMVRNCMKAANGFWAYIRGSDLELEGGKAAKDPFRWGVPWIKDVRRGRVNEYRAHVDALFDNRALVENEPNRLLKGVDPRQEAKRSTLAGLNGNDTVGAYFRAEFEDKRYDTWSVVGPVFFAPENPDTLAQNSEQTEEEKKWEAGLEKMLQHAEEHDGFFLSWNNDVSAIFEAAENLKILKRAVRKHRSLEFETTERRTAGIEVQKITYTFDPVDKVTRVDEEGTENYWSYGELIAARDSYQRTLSELLGLRPNPFQVAGTQLMRLTKIGKRHLWPTEIVKGFFVNGIGGVLAVFTGTGSWVVGKFSSIGRLRERLEVQAFRRARILSYYRTLLKRAERFDLNEREKEVLDRLVKSLTDPLQAPRSVDAETAFEAELQAEQIVQSSIDYGRAGLARARRMDFYEERVENFEEEGNVATSLGAKFVRWVSKHKFFVAITANVSATFTTLVIYNNWELLTHWALDKPNVAIVISEWTSERRMGWLRESSESLTISQLAAATLRNFQVENQDFPKLQELFLQHYFDRARANPGEDPFMDPQYHKDRNLVIRVYARLWGPRLEAAGVASMQDAWDDEVVPELVLAEIESILSERYPESEVYTGEVFRRFHSNGFLSDDALSIERPEGTPSELVEDMIYFFEKSFVDARDHFDRTGTLFGKGDPYEVWVRPN